MYYWIFKRNVSRDIPAFCALFISSFISYEKDKEKVPKIEGKHVIENLILLFEIIVHEHIDTQGTLVREHVSRQDTLALKHARHVSSWAHQNPRQVGM